MQISSEEDNDFLSEEVYRYRLSVQIDTKSFSSTGNDLEVLKSRYDELVADLHDKNYPVLIVVFDYDKDCNVYYYNSEDERA